MELLILVFLFFDLRMINGDIDPCNAATLLENVSKRGTTCLGTHLSSMVCDRQLQEGWYYAEHEGERLTMPTSCPSMFSCGTGGGFWLNGIHPSGINETADINVCMRGLPTDNDECCAETFPIKVKNCGQFYTYHLTYTSTCDQAYCFGDHSCPVTTTTSQQTTPTTTVPNQCISAQSIAKASLRGTQCLGTELPSMLCDRLFTPGWYYAEHEGRKLSMPSTCPAMLTCGTGGPIWIRDSHPTTPYTTIDVTACKRGLPTDNDPCCAKTYPVKITNCGDFFVYFLSYTDTCDEAYCFGDHECEDPSDHDGDEHEHDENDDSEEDDDEKHPWKHKSRHRKIGLVVIVAALFIGSIVGVIVVIMAKRRCQVNKSDIYEEKPDEKRVPIDYSSEPKKQPLPDIETYGGYIVPRQLVAPRATVLNVNNCKY